MKKLFLLALLSLVSSQAVCAKDEKKASSMVQKLWQATKPCAKIGIGVTSLGAQAFYWLYGSEKIGSLEGLDLKLKTMLESTIFPEGALRNEDELIGAEDYDEHPILYRLGNSTMLVASIIPAVYMIHSGINDLRKENELVVDPQPQPEPELDEEVKWYLKAKEKAKNLIGKVKASINKEL